MKKIAMMFGTPAAGKSTIVRRMMKEGSWEIISPIKLVHGHYSQERQLFVMGRYTDNDALGATYGGLDRLAQNVQPNAEYFAQETSWSLLIEGDRLSNLKFCSHILQIGCPVLILRVKASQEIIRARQIARGDDRTEQFLRSRETKYDNITIALQARGVEGFEVVENNDEKDQQYLYDRVQNFLEA